MAISRDIVGCQKKGQGVLLASNGQRRGMWLNIQGPPHPSTTTKNYPVQNVNNIQVEKTCLRQSHFKVWVYLWRVNIIAQPRSQLGMGSLVQSVYLTNRKNEVQRCQVTHPSSHNRSKPPVSNSSHFVCHSLAVFWELKINTNAFRESWFLPAKKNSMLNSSQNFTDACIGMESD